MTRWTTSQTQGQCMSSSRDGRKLPPRTKAQQLRRQRLLAPIRICTYGSSCPYGATGLCIYGIDAEANAHTDRSLTARKRGAQ